MTMIRPIEVSDNPRMAHVIRAVMTEFGAVGDGFSIGDPEVDGMFEAYVGEGHCFNVVVRDGQIFGGAGVAPLAGGEVGVCELRKMYVMLEGRGSGAGRDLMKQCLKQARELGFERCYLETLDSMGGARKLYRGFGFRDLPGPLGATGHGSCDKWMILEL